MRSGGKVKKKIKSARTTDLFKKGELRDKVEDTGKQRGMEKLYRVEVSVYNVHVKFFK